MIKKILVIAAVVLAMFTTGCSVVNTQPDEVALHYKGGMFSSAKFDKCIPVSNREFDGPGDNHYTYPNGQRTFSFTGREGSEIEPVPVVTNDSQELNVPGFVTFSLNTDCDTLRTFHERIGIKYGAYKDGGGWDAFLNDYLAVPLKASMNKASLDTDWRTLYSNAEAQKAFETYVKENLPEEVRKALGDDFIKIHEVSIEKPKPSQGLRDGLAAKEEAKLQDDAQKQKNAVARTKYDSMKDCRESGLSENACLTIYLADQGKVPFYPLPQGSDVVVNPK